MKFVCAVFFSCLIVSGSVAQTWSSFGGHQSTEIRVTYKDSATGFIYVGGLFDSIYNIAAKNIAFYDGTNWHPMGDGFNGRINSIVKFNNEIYAAGFFDSSGSIFLTNAIAKWDGIQWFEIDLDTDLRDDIVGGTRSIPWVQDLCIHNNRLFLSGMFFSYPNSNNPFGFEAIAFFDGNDIYAALNEGIEMFATNVELETFMGNLYLAQGSSILDTCPANLTGGNVIYGLSVYDSLCMKFSPIGNWPNCALYDLMSLDTALVFCTNFASSVFGNYISSYNGISISPIGDGFNSYTSSPIKYNNKLLISGSFISNYSGTAIYKYFAEWDGSNWQPLSTMCELNNGGSWLNNFDSLLICSGVFDSCGINPVFRSVSYPNAFAVGIEEESKSISISLYPNPCTDYLNIEVDPSVRILNVKCRNLLGQIQTFDSTKNENGIEISTVTLSSGIYLLEVTTSERIGYSKFYKTDSN